MDEPLPAFDELLAHDAYVRRAARALVGSDADADDVAQNVWLAAGRRPPDRRGPLRAWFAAVVRDAARKLRRGDARRARREGAAAAARPEAVAPTRVLEREETRRALVAAALALPEPQRTTALLRWFEGLPTSAVARTLGVPVETVRTRLKRAKADLRARLDAEFGDRARWTAALLPLSGGGAGVGGAAPVAPAAGVGAAVMSTKSKLAAAFVALVLSAWGWWATTGGGAARGPDTPGAGPTSAAGFGGAAGADAAAVARPTTQPSGDAPPPSRVASRPFAAEGAERGTLVVAVVVEGAESPAVGAPVDVELAAADPWLPATRRRALTDDRGVARFADLRPGRAGVEVRRAPEQAAEIRAGDETRLRFAVPAPFHVRGRVVDEAGAGVDGAAVLGDWSMALDGTPLTTTAADGAFAFPWYGGTCFVAARKDGWTDSAETIVLDGAGAALGPVVVLLRRRPGALAGRTLGPDGEPLAGVEVWAEWPRDERDPADRDAEGRAVIRNAPARAVSAADGTYRLAGLPVGRVALGAASGRHADFAAEVDVRAGEARYDVRFAAGRGVFGVVRDETGAPVGDARLIASRPGEHLRSAVSRADGVFRIGGLPDGPFAIEVDAGPRGRAVRAFEGDARAAAVEWNPVVGGAAIRGVYVDENGGPFSDAVVVAAREADGAPATRPAAFCRSGPDGSFAVFVPDAEARYEVRGLNRRGNGDPLATAAGVRPNGAPIELRIDPARRPSVEIRGRAVRPDGGPERYAHVEAAAPGVADCRAARTADDGSFRFGPLAAGNWTVTLRSASFGEIRVGPRALDAGALWDLGEVRFSAAGSLELETAVPADGSVRDAQDRVVLWFDASPGRTSFALQPGDYAVEARPHAAASYGRRFTIRAGVATTVVVPSDAGFLRTVRVVGADGLPVGPGVDVRLTDAAGVGLDRADPVESPLPASGVWSFRVGPGTYRLAATYGDRRGAAECVVGLDGEGDAEIRLVLAP